MHCPFAHRAAGFAVCAALLAGAAPAIAADAPPTGSVRLQWNASPNPSPNAGFVTAVYQRLLGRTPDGQAQQLIAGLDGKTLTREEVVANVLGSAEFRQRLVNDLYQSFLHRPAGGSSSLLGPGVTATQLSAAIAGSPEFYRAAGGTNEGFIKALFRALLGRAPSSVEQTTYVNLLKGGTAPTVVAQSLAQSAEGQTAWLARFYHTYLSSSGSPVGSTEMTVVLNYFDTHKT